MFKEHVEFVAGDFNVAANAATRLSIIQEAFADRLTGATWHHTSLWGPVSSPGEWADVCGFLKPPGSYEI